MVFQSYLFLAFLPAFLAGWWLLGRWEQPRLRGLWLLSACLVFYGVSSLTGLALLLGEGLVTWLLGREILRRPRCKKPLLFCGVTLLLGVLILFKYTGFFVQNINALLGTELTALSPALPLGLSFVTFQQIFYLRDCCAGELTALSLLDFAQWLTFFPTVSSGPITRTGELTVQLQDGVRCRFSWDHLASGLYCFSLGLFKKVLIADTLAGGANFGFLRAYELSSADAALTILAYTFQLYFDFSGYCDMAWGVAKMLGVDLPRNFDSPYRAVSVSDFWSRWHITLSRFFRTCVYIPLGGNRRGLARTCRNLLIIFLLSGLWHGAGWGFILWGALHGGAMVLERLLKGRVRLPRVLGWVLTFVFLNVAWVYFRAPTVDVGSALIRTALSFQPYLPSAAFCQSLLLPEFSKALTLLAVAAPEVSAFLMRAVPLLIFPLCLGLCLLVPNPIRQAEQLKPTAGKVFVCVAALCWAVVSFSRVSTFLYANF